MSDCYEYSLDNEEVSMSLDAECNVDMSLDNDAVFEYNNTGEPCHTNYNELSDKPSINGVILSGNKTGADLGLVDAVEGQGLSDNNLTDELLNKLNAAASGGSGSAPLYLSNTNSDIAGYKRLSYTPDAVEVVKTITATNSTVYGETYLFDLPIGVDVIAAGQWIFDYWRAVSSASGDSFSRLESFLRHADGSETTTYFIESPSIENTSIEQRTINYALPQFNMLPTDRFGFRMALRTTRNAPTIYSYIVGGQRGHSITVPIPPRHDYLRDKDGNPDFNHVNHSERFEGGLATGNTILPTVKDVADAVANMLPKPPEEQDLYSYGVVIDTRLASPILQRIGSSDLSKLQPIVNNFKACILNDDATINYYLDKNDVTKKALDGLSANLDGTDGQIMIEIPDIWRKITELDSYRTEIRFSPYEIVGFEKIEGFYYSPVLASVHRPTNKLSSVINASVDYRGGNNDATRDANANTQLGMCATALCRTQFRNYAQNRGIKYIGSTYYMNEVLLQLYWCEYANLNMQDAYIASLTADGYRQGGLGPGVTTIDGTNWNTFNGYYPLIPNGVGFQSVGVNTGIKNYTISGLGVSVDIPVWHGIENIFGHLYQSEDGVNIEIQANGSGGLSKAYICKNIRFFSDSITSEYTYVGNISRVGGWITQMIKGTILPLAVGGSSNTYYCDYSYTTIPTTGVSIRQVLRGGAAQHGSNAGLSFSSSSNTSSYASSNISSRLCAVKSL